MDIYHYDRVTGEFLGAGKADPDPMQPGHYLIPALATDMLPPAAEANQTAVFTDDGWAVVPDYRGTEYWLADGACYVIQQIGRQPPAEALFEPPQLPLLTVHLYDPVTGEYTGSEQLQPDLNHPDRYPVPANATRETLPALADNQAAVFKDGAWAAVPDYRGTKYWLADRSHHTISALGEEPPENALFEEPPEPEKPVPERKADLCKKIDLAADEARKRFVSPGDLIDKEYDLALQQARIWIDAGMPDPVPSAVQSGVAASGGQLTPEQAAQEIVATATAWEDALLQIRALRLEGKAAVQQAPDDTDFEAVAGVYLERMEGVGY